MLDYNYFIHTYIHTWRPDRLRAIQVNFEYDTFQSMQYYQQIEKVVV